MAAEYETISGRVETEIEISRSRFLTRLERVSSEEDARAVIAAVRAEHPRARHHCSAFVLGPDGRVQRSNDDGEPSGTAGAPMLDALVSAGLSDVVAVVTRYFGGVLLGAGGLTRAYRASVAGAVLDAKRVRRGLRLEVSVRSTYEVASQIEAEARRRGYTVGEADYSDTVLQRFAVAEDEVGGLTALAAELSAGAAVVAAGDSGYVDLG
ncbi:putative YigZ family protein [Leucobacter komagatae]|uniref:Putative YigZ family protein n=1 Tax=Leucobacter komagatae TaxID=55969 RepID=A0A542Y7S8_9MICO|nr:YigZ family protein [Leucobacter komagatae]TQL44034.1 putative YigZ family protein [Leucobacter komagatae]